DQRCIGLPRASRQGRPRSPASPPAKARAKRDRGRGRGAAKFPLVLGNDFAGTVATVGARVSAFKCGDRVYGLKPASTHGTHASHVVVKAAHVLRTPTGGDPQALAAIPYSFVTMWLAVRGAGLTSHNAAAKKVLVH